MGLFYGAPFPQRRRTKRSERGEEKEEIDLRDCRGEWVPPFSLPTKTDIWMDGTWMDGWMAVSSFTPFGDPLHFSSLSSKCDL